jgi:hypothetical protein
MAVDKSSRARSCAPREEREGLGHGLTSFGNGDAAAFRCGERFEGLLRVTCRYKVSTPGHVVRHHLTCRSKKAHPRRGRADEASRLCVSQCL